MKGNIKYPEKTEKALALWVKLSRAYNSFSKKATENIKEFDLTLPQFGAIECLGHLGAMTIGQLSSKHLVSGGNMTFVIDNLEKQELVERVLNKQDRRTIIVRLTPKGKKLFDTVFSKHADYLTSLVSALSEKEVEQLSALLKKLGTSIKDV